jgi:hypothetical protein
MKRYDTINRYDSSIRNIVEEKSNTFVSKIQQCIAKSELGFDYDEKKIRIAVQEVFNTDPFMDYIPMFTISGKTNGTVLFTFDSSDPLKYYCTVTMYEGKYYLWVIIPAKINRKIASISSYIKEKLSEVPNYKRYGAELDDIIKWACLCSLGERLNYEVVGSEEEFFRRPFGNLIYDFYTGKKVYALFYQTFGHNPVLRVFVKKEKKHRKMFYELSSPYSIEFGELQRMLT